MLDVFEAAETAVRNACRFLGMNEADARKLVRGEISIETFSEIRRTLDRDRLYFSDEFMRGSAPLTCRGVNFYMVQRLPVPWRVIGLGQTSGGRVCHTVTEGKVDAEVG